MKYLFVVMFLITGCATVQPTQPSKVSQGGKSNVPGTGNVTIIKTIDGRQNVQIDLIGQPLAGLPK